MKIRTCHASLASLSAVLINVKAKNFKELHTCRGSVAMATIYVVIITVTVYESTMWNTHAYVQTGEVVSISDVILKHFKLGQGTLGTQPP